MGVLDKLGEKWASSFRNKLGHNDVSPLPIKSILLELNVLAVFTPLGDNFSGMAIKTGEDGKYILVNSSQTVGRQNFTICHELYHLFIQENFHFRQCTVGRFNRQPDLHETKADHFASNLLIPNDGILKHIPEEEFSKDKITIPTLLRIENVFSCSRSALLYSLKRMGLISPQKYEELSTNVIKGARLYGFDTSLYKPNNEENVIGNYGQLAKYLYDNDEISESHYMTLMDAIGVDIHQEDYPINEPE